MQTKLKVAVEADSWIYTHKGIRFWPLDPIAEEVDIEDIAHALSMKCRYGGHCAKFYSVAQHSVHVSELVAPEHAMWGLLHDASEAYLPDVARPIKPYLSGFKYFEAAVMRAVAEKFGLPGEEPEEVKAADHAILFDEMELLMPAANLVRAPTKQRTLNRLRPWDQKTAKGRFLQRFKQLGGKV
jgi:5'-deoxynucleotidase YfbR-like HD superfamily hydrolase